MNQLLVGAWQQEAMPQQEDYGQPDGEPGQDGGDDAQGGQGGQDFGQGDDGEAQDFGQQDDGGQGEQQPPQQPGQDMAKSFGLPVFRIEA